VEEGERWIRQADRGCGSKKQAEVDGHARRTRHLVEGEPPDHQDDPVTDRIAARLVWSLWAFAIVLAVAQLMLLVFNQPVLHGVDRLQPEIVAIPGFATMGAVLTARRPRNPIGWVFLAVALGAAVEGFTLQYAIRALAIAPGSLPLGWFMAWLSQIVGPVGILPLALLLLLFPNGRLPSRRWRPLVWVLGLCTLFLTVGLALYPDPLDLGAGRQFPTPIGISIPPWVLAPYFVFPVWFVALLASAAAPLFRLRRATGDERLQLKWLAYVAGVVASVGLIASLTVNDHPLVGNSLGVLVVVGVGVGFPVATGIAILKHRLYDIDRLISRTLVYGTLTAVLGLGYIAGVLLLRQLTGAVTGSSSLAVAGSTLAMAALFQPARRWIQQAVDRRFNRHRYDAARTIQTFSARLREQIDLDTLTKEVLAVVDHTMQPTTVSLWLRPPNETSKSHATGWDY
jgi:hypothetical protein